MNRLLHGIIVLTDHQADGGGQCYCTECEEGMIAMSRATNEELQKAKEKIEKWDQAKKTLEELKNEEE